MTKLWSPPTLARPLLLAVLALVLSNCGHSHDGEDHSHGEESHSHDEDDEALSDTVWNDRFELFMEHPPLRSGETVDFLVHLTILDGSRPVTEGPVSFIFTRSGRELRRINAEEPLRPGIFSLSTSFDEPGPLVLTVDIQGGPVKGSIKASPLTVHAKDDPASLAAQGQDTQEGTIGFLKEQQWTVDFSTTLAEQRRIEGFLNAPARVTAPSGLDSTVFSPSQGLYRQPPEGVPRQGSRVRKGTLLGWVEPTPAERIAMASSQIQAGQTLVRLRNDLAQAESDVTEQKSRLQTARQEIQRLERLLELQAVPRKRLEEAQSRREIHQASLEAAQTRRQQLRQQLQKQTAQTDAQKLDQRLALHSPITGKIVAAQAADGQSVDSRQELFRIINLDQAWINAQVSESEMPRLKALNGALLDLPGGEQIRLEASRLVDVGSVVDPASRTVPVIWQAPNPGGLLRAGMLLEVRMRTDDDTPAAVAIPSQAVLIEDDKLVVYVQVSGESFARRIVRTGARDASWTQVIEGLEEGERVVVEGAYEVALAARAGDASAAHGHAH
ncbi:MAG TPA: efflux RND transporter periplasmic adaptor subunit [Acidobacteriota bacterium]|nr:efflux RND transporter periplasmic adaptor subunit [Acidobacteriota bacterium]